MVNSSTANVQLIQTKQKAEAGAPAFGAHNPTCLPHQCWKLADPRRYLMYVQQHAHAENRLSARCCVFTSIIPKHRVVMGLRYVASQ